MTISKHIPNDIKRVSRSIGYALWVGDIEQWFGLSAVLRSRLTTQQRAALAFQSLKSMNQDQAVATATLALRDAHSGPQGMPIAPLFDVFDEAMLWAANTEPEELEAYLVAIFNVIPARRKAAFLDYAGRIAA